MFLYHININLYTAATFYKNKEVILGRNIKFHSEDGGSKFFRNVCILP